MIYIIVLIGFFVGCLVWFGAGYPIAGAIICSISLTLPWLSMLIDPVKRFCKFIWSIIKPIR